MCLGGRGVLGFTGVGCGKGSLRGVFWGSRDGVGGLLHGFVGFEFIG